MDELLVPNHFEVACNGQLVVLTVGNVSYSIEFHLALMLAAAMKYQARIAKLNSGRDDRGFFCIGVLHDAAAEKPKRRRFIERLPELLKPRGLDVYAAGSLVVLRIGRTTAKLTFAGARTLSQWLRIRGKEAKLNAGEKRHWSEIDNMHVAAEGARAW